jgi:nucleotide-binding universal stress UspA family protein
MLTTMSVSGLFVAVVVTWFVIGLVLAVVMGRRGHAPFSWFVLGTLLGPLALVLALDAARRERRAAGPAPAPEPARAGGLAVLAGVDGSAESLAALDAACRILGPRIARLTLAGVVTYDAAESGLAVEREAVGRALDEAAARAAALGPRTVVLVGRPDEALARYAAEGGYDLVVVGRRGRGRSRAVLGSVASRLAAGTPVPVLIGPAPTAPSPTPAAEDRSAAGTGGRSP